MEIWYQYIVHSPKRNDSAKHLRRLNKIVHLWSKTDVTLDINKFTLYHADQSVTFYILNFLLKFALLILEHCDTWHFFPPISYSFIPSVKLNPLFNAMQLRWLRYSRRYSYVRTFFNFEFVTCVLRRRRVPSVTNIYFLTFIRLRFNHFALKAPF